ncbi:MAG: DeoR family transcriptional regulator, partial [Anaerolineae bacterium]|nr:DeoR family transcriptional regulator [Anaerolineae bacterium]
MKRNASGVKLLTEQRRNKIVDKIQSLGLVAIDELVAELGVSQMTIWRDLIALE